MPKITDTPKTRVQINADSDLKRGVKTKGIKMTLEDIALLEQLSNDTGIPQNQIVAEAIKLWADSKKAH